MNALDLFAALGIAVGLVGVLVPLLPGSLLVGGSILAWAAITDEAAGWIAFGVAAAVLAAGSVVKYVLPGKQLKDGGVPTSTLVAGAALGLLGFFVVPVVGLPLGFVLGVYLAEWHRTSHAEAWPATISAVRAVGVGIALELGFCILAAGAWVVGVATT